MFWCWTISLNLIINVLLLKMCKLINDALLLYLLPNFFLGTHIILCSELFMFCTKSNFAALGLYCLYIHYAYSILDAILPFSFLYIIKKKKLKINWTIGHNSDWKKIGRVVDLCILFTYVWLNIKHAWFFSFFFHAQFLFSQYTFIGSNEASYTILWNGEGRNSHTFSKTLIWVIWKEHQVLQS